MALPESVTIHSLGSPANEVIDGVLSGLRVLDGTQGYSLGCIIPLVVGGRVASAGGIEDSTCGPEPGVPWPLTLPPMASMDCQLPLRSVYRYWVPVE